MSNDLETELTGTVIESPPPPPPIPPLEEEDDDDNPNSKFGKIQEDITGIIYYVSGANGKRAKKGDKVLFNEIPARNNPKPRARINSIL